MTAQRVSLAKAEMEGGQSWHTLVVRFYRRTATTSVRQPFVSTEAGVKALSGFSFIQAMAAFVDSTGRFAQRVVPGFLPGSRYLRM